jgi:hypothetical protein
MSGFFLLDPKTVLVIIVLGSLSMSIGLLIASFGYLKQAAEVRGWAWANLFLTGGWLWVGPLRDFIPVPISIIAGNFSRKALRKLRNSWKISLPGQDPNEGKSLSNLDSSILFRSLNL